MQHVSEGSFRKLWPAAAISVLMLCTLQLSAQHGGKAEARRIKFAPGTSSAVVTGTLSNYDEMDYVFAAGKGQKVTVKNSNHNLFDFRIYSEEFDVETEFESSPIFTLELPATGDYFFYVRKKLVNSPKRARYSMTISIR